MYKILSFPWYKYSYILVYEISCVTSKYVNPRTNRNRFLGHKRILTTPAYFGGCSFPGSHLGDCPSITRGRAWTCFSCLWKSQVMAMKASVEKWISYFTVSSLWTEYKLHYKNWRYMYTMELPPLHVWMFSKLIKSNQIYHHLGQKWLWNYTGQS